MVTGQKAFQGTNKISTLSAILHQEPKPVSGITPTIPADLEKLINRCLRKDPAKRFQHMDDVQVALQELKEESDSGVLAAAPPRRPERRRVLPWAAGLAIALAAGTTAWFLVRRSTPADTVRVETLGAAGGFKWGPALSPDGGQVAFVWNGEKQDNEDIYVQLVDEPAPRRLTSDPAFDYSPVWSPDGLRIAFLRDTPAGTEIRTVPAASGTERRVHLSLARCRFGASVMARQFCGLAWSPDGKFLSIVDKESPQAPSSVFLLDLATRARRKLTTPPPGWFGDGLSAFSPDGRTLAFARSNIAYASEIYTLAIGGRY
jgi:Tol biopolymer transport system component